MDLVPLVVHNHFMVFLVTHHYLAYSLSYITNDITTLINDPVVLTVMSCRIHSHILSFVPHVVCIVLDRTEPGPYRAPSSWGQGGLLNIRRLDGEQGRREAVGWPAGRWVTQCGRQPRGRQRGLWPVPSHDCTCEGAKVKPRRAHGERGCCVCFFF